MQGQKYIFIPYTFLVVLCSPQRNTTMSKNTHFFGQSVFGQLISLIDNSIVTRNGIKHNADRYIKKFTTKDHLISMLFGVFAKVTSLREVSGAMLGLSGKTKHFQLGSLPYRSTLSDANKRKFNFLTKFV